MFHHALLQGLARAGALPEAAKLARDMWARLGMLDKVCHVLGACIVKTCKGGHTDGMLDKVGQDY